MSARFSTRSDLTREEQEHVRAALRYLRVQSGSWAMLGKAIGISARTLKNVNEGRPMSASVAVRAARLAGVSVDAVLAGEYPPDGVCPHCGKESQALADDR